MEIVVGDIYSSILQPRSNPRALAIIREVCRARPNGYRFMPKYKSGYWDGYISLMKDMSTFPTGLLDLVVGKLDEYGVQASLWYKDGRLGDFTTVCENDLSGIILREYQINAANALLGFRRGVAKMATNSGKTEVMAAIIKALHVPKTVVLLHRKELLHQTAKRFEDRLDIRIGKIGDGIWDPQTITVAMIQTLSNKLNVLDVNGNVLVMIDECHHVSSDTMMDVLSSIPGCYRFGFSGTPLKYDVLSDMKLIAYTGEVVFDLGNKWMIEHEYSAEPTINVSVISDGDDDLWDMNYSDAYDNLIVRNDVRNARIRQFAENDNGTVLILVERIEHGKLLQESIRGSAFVSGGDSTEFRKEVIDSMGKGGIFIATPIFDEGIDIPAISTLILAGSGKNHVKILQRIGRGLRKKENGNRLTVYDFIDDNNKFLFKQSSARVKLYASEGFKTTLLR